jgi:hypothetical protein
MDVVPISASVMNKPFSNVPFPHQFHIIASNIPSLTQCSIAHPLLDHLLKCPVTSLMFSCPLQCPVTISNATSLLQVSSATSVLSLSLQSYKTFSIPSTSPMSPHQPHVTSAPLMYGTLKPSNVSSPPLISLISFNAPPPHPLQCSLNSLQCPKSPLQ